MITGNEAAKSPALQWPIKAQHWLNGWKEPGRPQTAAEMRKSEKLLEILTDLREKARAGELNSREAQSQAIDRLISIHDPYSLHGLSRRDCCEAQEARDILYAIIRENPEDKTGQLKAVIPQGFEPSDFG